MSKGRETGKGEVHLDLGDVDDPLFMVYPCKSASLENYNIDGDELKPEHKLWLDDQFVPFAKSDPKPRFKVEGFASHSGDAAYNQALSERRVKNLLSYLVGKGIPLTRMPFTLIQAHGERMASSQSNECSKDRAVRISVVTDRPPPPPPPPPKRKSTPGKPDDGWLPIPPRLDDRITVVVQEIYLRYDYISIHEPPSPHRVSHPWVRLDSRTTWGVVSPNNTGSVGISHGMRGMVYFRNPGMQKWVNGHLAVFWAVAHYTYSPAAQPAHGSGFACPMYAEDVFPIYRSGNRADPPRPGPV